MTKKETRVSESGRREFLKIAGIALAGTATAGFRSGRSGPERAVADQVVASEKESPVPGLSEREAAYYRPLFEHGRDLAG